MKQYTAGFTTRNEELVTIMPNWFERLILRRKPKVVTLIGAAGKLGKAAREYEEALMRSMFADGKK